MKFWAFAVFSLFLSLSLGVSADTPQCGWQADGALCSNDLCCSKDGYCGSSYPYCGDGCQSQCHNVSRFIPESVFEEMLPNRNNCSCPAKGFYTYDAFIEATKSYPAFGMTGNDSTKIRELAAFFGQTSQETNGRWLIGEDAPYTWGYCYVNELNPKSDYCVENTHTTFACVPGKKYYGRGPIQLRWNENYGRCGRNVSQRLEYYPERVAIDPLISFKTALWFWMTPHSTGAPSCHDVITGNWSPSEADIEAGRIPGFGLLTNIITNGTECNKDFALRVQERIQYYQRYRSLLGVDPDNDHLDCYDQKPFDNDGLLKMVGTI